MKNLWKKTKGQITIPFAILFVIIFCLFAMPINISLTVGDKINLQNASDLAAYYGAKRQAELLNAIAHLNYQIRQEWKLMVWRYRILGSISHDENPTKKDPSIYASFDPNIEKEEWNSDGGSPICLWGSEFWSINAKDNLCGTPSTSVEYPSSALIATTVINTPSLSSHIRSAEIADKAAQASCRTISGLNFWFASSVLFLRFKKVAAKKMNLIRELERRLIEGRQLDGDSILEGVKKVFINNLNNQNRKNFFEGGDLKAYNSAKSIGHIFEEIQTYIDINFADTACTQGSVSEASKIVAKNVTLGAFNINDPEVPDYFEEIGAPTLLSKIDEQLKPSGDFDGRVIWGIEKREGTRIYFAVHAELPRKGVVFETLSGNRTPKMHVRSLAKPFGGRIGPKKHTQTEESGGKKSDDLLSPPRMNERPDNSQTNQHPNYSRFPGDERGLLSPSAFYSLDMKLLVENGRLRDSHYDDVISHKGSSLLWSYPDSLARKRDLDQNDLKNLHNTLRIRMYEILAILPDPFDLMYYSIAPHFWNVYGRKFYQSDPPDKDYLHDLGSVYTDEGALVDAWSISKQIYVALKDGAQFFTNYAFYLPHGYKGFGGDRNFLLNGWVNRIKIDTLGGDSEYVTPEKSISAFMKCSHYDIEHSGQNSSSAASSFYPEICSEGDATSENHKCASSKRCIFGGRSGYSVRLFYEESFFNQADGSWEIVN